MQVVVLTGVPLSKQLEINDWTHQNGVHFIAADTRGLFGCVLLRRNVSRAHVDITDLLSTTLDQNSPA